MQGPKLRQETATTVTPVVLKVAQMAYCLLPELSEPSWLGLSIGSYMLQYQPTSAPTERYLGSPTKAYPLGIASWMQGDAGRRGRWNDGLMLVLTMHEPNLASSRPQKK